MPLHRGVVYRPLGCHEKRAPVSPQSFANSRKGGGQGRLPFPISRPVSTEPRSLWLRPACPGFCAGPARANRKEPRLMLSVPLWLISAGIWRFWRRVGVLPCLHAGIITLSLELRCPATCNCIITYLMLLRHFHRRLCADCTMCTLLASTTTCHINIPLLLLMRSLRLKFLAQGCRLKSRWEPEPQLFWIVHSLGWGRRYLTHDCHLSSLLATSCCWGAEAASSLLLPLLLTPASIIHSAPSSPHPSPQSEPVLPHSVSQQPSLSTCCTQGGPPLKGNTP